MRNYGAIEVRVRGALMRKLEDLPGGFTIGSVALRTLVQQDGGRRLKSVETIQRIGQRIAKEKLYELDDGVAVRYFRGVFSVKVTSMARFDKDEP